MGKEEIEMRKKFIKTLLSQYLRISEKSGISPKRQEGTTDNYLAKISDLNNELEDLNKKK